MKCVNWFIFLLMSLTRCANGNVVQLAGGAMVDVDREGVEELVTHLIEHHYSGCHVVLLTTAPHSPTFSAIKRYRNKSKSKRLHSYKLIMKW